MVLAIMCSGHGCASQSAVEDVVSRAQIRPNIVYILADDLGYGDLGVYGQELISTPNIDRLAAEGMRFTQHYAGSTVCAPSRASLMSGLHTGHTYIRGNKPIFPEGQYPIPASRITVAEVLQDVGYKTAAIGKWGLGAPGTEGLPTRQGFDYFFGYNDQREAHSYYPDHLWRNEERVDLLKNEEGQRGTYSHDLLTDEVLTFLQKKTEEPFFLYIPYTIPHAALDVPDDSMLVYEGQFQEKPWEAEGSYIGQETPRTAYAAMVSRLDADIGRILRTLETQGLLDQTLVIFTSDNGPHQEAGADPIFFNSNGGLRGIKRDLYEGGIRVPMIAMWQGVIQENSVTDHISAFWDVMPTLCAIIGVDPPPDIDGISFLPTLLGESQVAHDYLYWEFHELGGKQAIRMNNWKGVRLNVHDNPVAPIELYDLSRDRQEARNLSFDYPNIVTRIAQLMDEAHTPSDLFVFPGDDP